MLIIDTLKVITSYSDQNTALNIRGTSKLWLYLFNTLRLYNTKKLIKN